MIPFFAVEKISQLRMRKTSWPLSLRKIFPSPLENSFFWEALYIIFFLVFQDYIIPQLFPKMYIDLLSPWILISFVLRKPLRFLPLSIFAVILIENHSSWPFAFFFTLYWVFGVFLSLFRQHISWTNFLSWGVLFSLAQLFILVMESVSYGVSKLGNYEGLPYYLVPNISGSFLSILFGLFIVYKFRLDTLEVQRLAQK